MTLKLRWVDAWANVSFQYRVDSIGVKSFRQQMLSNRSKTYNVFAFLRDVPAGSPQKQARTRPQSLQKIKINHKGLPQDFFKPKTSRQNFHKLARKTRTETLPNEFENIRATPSFQQYFVVQIRNPRECKSQERISKTCREPKIATETSLEPQGPLTFSKSFFIFQKPSPKTIDLRKRRGWQAERKEDSLAECSARKDELTELIKRRNVDKEKYPYLMWPRTHSKMPNRLPILKIRFPSAFGI